MYLYSSALYEEGVVCKDQASLDVHRLTLVSPADGGGRSPRDLTDQSGGLRYRR